MFYSVFFVLRESRAIGCDDLRWPRKCAVCAEDIRKVVEKSGYKAKLLKPHQIAASELPKGAMYIQPGGDNTMNVRRAVGPKGLSEIQKFVSNGGKYIGICLGGVLGATGKDDDNSNMLGLLPVRRGTRRLGFVS